MATSPNLIPRATRKRALEEPGSIIAAQRRHADGGALAQRVYIHQLPQTAPPAG